MTNIDSLKSTCRWQLLRGSHPFPGPDGGTCFNEAAIVAAGHPYNPVQSVDDCPASFSRPLSFLAMFLNDNAGDADRQRLIPFVPRLAGSADGLDVEIARARFVVSQIVERRLPDRHVSAEALKSLAFLREEYDDVPVALLSQFVLWANNSLPAEQLVIEAPSFELSIDGMMTWLSATQPISKRISRPGMFGVWLDAFDQALKIGRQADPIDGALVVARMEEAKREGARREAAITLDARSCAGGLGVSAPCYGNG